MIRSGIRPLLVALLTLSFFIGTTVRAEIQPRKTEMRGVWIATVANIDWPDKRALAEQQKQELCAILDSLHACNFNTVAFQVRPTADAFYKSALEPWSAYLTGTQGKAPSPEYDPLAFMIEEAHKRCMEVHVWMNPYRVINGGDTTQLISNHLYFERPELFAWYGGKLYFNPAFQDVRDYLTMIVMDIVLRYDLDAIHFDDYFYPYKEKGQEFPDDDAFQKLGGDFKKKEDWRRNNVDLVIEQLQQTIKAARPWIQFGIAPFGNNSTNVNELYADVTKWIRNGWIDYVAPQLYWNIGHRISDYSRLYDWWSKECQSLEKGNTCNLYIGQYASGLEIYDQTAWKTPNELIRQTRQNYEKNTDLGSFFYSNKYVIRNPQGLLDSLRASYYQYPALQPAAGNYTGTASAPPANLRIESNFLQWDPVTGKDGNAVRYYVVYALPEDSTDNQLLPERILTTTPNSTGGIYLPNYCELLPAGSRIVVTSFNRFRKESKASNCVVTD
ncbi:MAG: family 10 glycosylhydrolase [Paludibacteraceae bacterium]|nr:family 10 glycosylhydrolase [Paludibacteraceae bacterium]